jgi:type VI protein secretion system component VasF
MIGAGIALLWYLFLLLGAERRIPMWLFGSAGVLLLCICYYGFTVAVRKAKP